MNISKQDNLPPFSTSRRFHLFGLIPMGPSGDWNNQSLRGIWRLIGRIK